MWNVVPTVFRVKFLKTTAQPAPTQVRFFSMDRVLQNVLRACMRPQEHVRPVTLLVKHALMDKRVRRVEKDRKSRQKVLVSQFVPKAST